VQNGDKNDTGLPYRLQRKGNKKPWIVIPRPFHAIIIVLLVAQKRALLSLPSATEELPLKYLQQIILLYRILS